MTRSFDFLRLVVDSLADHIAVIDMDGVIVFTNRAWDRFGRENDCRVDGGWTGVGYLDSCDRSAELGDDFGRRAAAGIRQVIGGAPAFKLEYPCHSPGEKRWFMMGATSFEHGGAKYLVVAHVDITERKLAEEYALGLSRLDGLTGLANRRFFEEFYDGEWKRCSRLGLPIAVAMVDIDFFKLLNDSRGHQAGDECLVALARLLRQYAKRPGDICARYGGEEFVLVFGNSTAAGMLPVLSELKDRIQALGIPNEASSVAGTVTVSVGLSSMYPSQSDSPDLLVGKADALLYRAKAGGRNRIETDSLP